MSGDWITSTIDDVCEVEFGTRVVRRLDGGSAFPVYGGGGATFSMDAFNRESRVVIARFGMSKECSRFVLGKFFLNDSGLTLSTKSPSRIIQNYLDWFTLSLNESIFNLGRGTAQKNLDVTALRALPVVYPRSLEEQERIAAILDEAFEGIDAAGANAEKNLANARELFKSYRELALVGKPGWLKKPLVYLCDIKHGFAFKSEFFTDSGEHIVLTPGNFYESGGYRDRGEKQKYYRGDILRDFVLSPGDLLVAMTEQAAGLLGSPVLIPESGTFLHNQRLGLVTKKPDVNWMNEFFFHVFNTRRVRAAIHDGATGVKVRHTSPTKIGEVVVAFPECMSEQRAVVASLNSVAAETQHLGAVYAHKLAVFADLKRSLLHKAFAGQLTTRRAAAVPEAAQ